MKATINKTASQAAEEALDFVNNKKSRIIVGKKIIEEKKSKSKYFLLIFIVVLLFLFFIINKTKKYQVQGSVHIDGKFAQYQEINFLDKNRNLIKIKSDKLGKFTVNLQEGIYKIYLTGSEFRRYSKSETTPFSLKLNKNMEELRIYIPKI